MQVARALRDAAGALAAVSDTARLDAEVMMAGALGVSRSDLLLRHMGDGVPGCFADFVARRMRHEPVAYVVGHQEFYGRDFLVTPEVLIPRGDSEVLVETALGEAPDARRVLDCGTGSGALVLSVLAERPDLNGVGIDRSLGALAVAAANAARLGLTHRVRMLRRDWDMPGWSDGLGPFGLILANPPYVEMHACLSRSVRDYEPAGALFAGPDGLAAYRVLLAQLPAMLDESGVVLVEIGAAQADDVRAIAEAAGFNARLQHDLGGRPRVLVLRFGLGKAGQPR